MSWEITGVTGRWRHRHASYETVEAAERTVTRLLQRPDLHVFLHRHYDRLYTVDAQAPPEQTYPDETWHWDDDTLGQVGVGTFVYDDLAGALDPTPIRVMAEDDDGAAHPYLSLPAARSLHRALGLAIRRVEAARAAGPTATRPPPDR